MSSQYPKAKTLMSVSPINWLPGSLSGCFPFFSVQNGVLFFRADDPNLYGVTYAGSTTALPQVFVNGVTKLANKGCNFYSAPWCIPTLSCRDTGKSVKVVSIDPSIFTYITAFYKNLTGSIVNLTNFEISSSGYAKQYQVVYGNRYNITNGVLYYGASGKSIPEIGGVETLVSTTSPNISITGDHTFNGAPLPTYQQSYNTFYAIDTPIVISAIDTSNGSTKLYFTLQNSVTVYNGPTFSQ